MSVLETPRLIFRGEIAWDPITTNNHHLQYDEDTARTIFDASAPSVAAFRQSGIDLVIRNKKIYSWNPDGTHRSKFFDTYVTGVDLGSGVQTDDAIIKCPVSFTGMLVDLEPYGSTSSQLFFDSMSFGIMGGCQMLAPREFQTSARYVNFVRSANGPIAGVASVVWQTSFCKKSLQIADHDSKVLQQFKKHFEDPEIAGLTVRWNTYRTNYFDTPGLDTKDLTLGAALQAMLRGGGLQPNPARSRLVGVLGLWRQNEPPCEPCDRAIVGPTVTSTAPPFKALNIGFGSAHVRLVGDDTLGNRLVLDLSNTVPEVDLDCTKADYGDLIVAAMAPTEDGPPAVPPPAAPATIASIGYDLYARENYERTAGIVALDLSPQDAALFRSTGISISAPKADLALWEQRMRAVAKRPNIYIDEGESSHIEVQVLDRGAPAGAGVPVTLTNTTSSSNASIHATTDGGGVARFPLKGVKGQVEAFTLMAGNGTPATSVDALLTTYVNVRTLPSDAFLLRMPATWGAVHQFVLRNWEAMAPCMDNWLRLGDEAQVRAFRPILEKLTAKANFESFLYMPVTRDMTLGQRSLLYRFLNGAVTEVASATQASSPTPETLSRRMRGA